jgi:2-oxoglutarate ferredoxin oxidoreductase subunit alpha
MQAFNLAEKYRCPVFIASNKEIAMTRESVDMDALQIPDIVTRTAPPAGKKFLPFQIRKDRCVPDFLPIGGDVPVRQTSSTHGVNGYITTDHNEIAAIIKRLKTKIHSAIFNELKNTNHKVSVMVIKTLWPVPETVIRRATRDISRVVVVEMNLGQYVHEIGRILPDKSIELHTQMDGRLITPHDIMEKIING